MRVTGYGLHDFEMSAAHLAVDNRIRAPLGVEPHAALLDEPMTVDDDELLDLGVVPVVALDLAGARDVDGQLAEALAAQHLGETAARVGVHRQRIGELVRRQVTEIRGVELAGKGIAHVGQGQTVAPGGKGAEQIGNAAQSDRMFDRDATIVALAVRMTAEGADKLVDNIVDVDHVELDGGVVDLDGQVVGQVVTERGHDAVVVGPAPLAEQVREAVDQHRSARAARIVEEELLAGPLGLAVGVVERRLGGRREHDGTAVAMAFEGGEQVGGKAEIAAHEVGRILRTVDAGKVEDEIGPAAIVVEFGGRIAQVVLKDFEVGRQVVAAGLRVAHVAQLRHEVPPDEAFGAGH